MASLNYPIVTQEEKERAYESGRTDRGVIETPFGRIKWEAERIEDQNFMNWLSKNINSLQKKFKSCQIN